MIRSFLKRVIESFGYRIVRKSDEKLFHLYTYENGYEQYKAVQRFHNKRKLNAVWADETTLSRIRDYILASNEDRASSFEGICHGARNGFEVAWFNTNLPGRVIGTDISEAALGFDNMEVWDFHDEKEAWKQKFDFLYTNSLDHAMDPRRALLTWSQQVKPGGLIFIEHTMRHAAERACEMDPFGAHPMCMPYLFFEWAKEALALHDILHIEAKANHGYRAWVFVLRSKSVVQQARPRSLAAI